MFLERYGDFELIRLIATGGMAEIYLGQQAGLGGFSRPVVVKRMLPQLAVRQDFVTMFLDEARLAANLNHPNIASVTNLGEVDGSYFIAMELVDGPHLGALFAHSLRLRKPLPLDLCCYIVARAADGLHYAHERNDPATGQPLMLVHRDISPQNILVSREGEVKVTDFGVAKASTHQTKTRTGIIKGKVAYMSPEQCLGEVVDKRTDVFALGIVMYELLTRRRLFRDKSDLLIMQKITGEDVPAPSTVNKDVDAELDAICAKALARTREQRFQSAADLAEALDAWVVGRNVGDSRATLARWFEANASDLAITSGEVTQAHISTASVSRPASRQESTSATPSLASAETAMIRSRPEERLPSRAAVLEPEATEATRRTAAASQPEPTADEPETLLDAAGGARPPTGAPPMGGESVGAQTEQLSLDSLQASLDAASHSPFGDQTSPPTRRLPIAAMAGGGVALALVAFLALRSSDIAPSADGGVVALGVADAGPIPTPVPSVRADLETVTIETVPDGAALFDDKGAFLHNAPYTFEREPGTFRVSAQFADQRIAQDVVLEKGQPAAVRIVAKVPLKVNVEGVRATVKVNGKSKGETPLELPAFLVPGEPVKLQLSALGYEPRDVEVVAQPGVPLEITEALKKKGTDAAPTRPREDPPAFGVVHVRTLGVAITSAKLDGEKLPDLPFRNHKTKAGRRQLVLSNPAEKVSESVAISVPADGEITVIVEFEKKGDRWKAKRPTIR
jgi:serine/threonine protein kinase